MPQRVIDVGQTGLTLIQLGLHVGNRLLRDPHIKFDLPARGRQLVYQILPLLTTQVRNVHQNPIQAAITSTNKVCVATKDITAKAVCHHGSAARLIGR